jgi:hypothetical protein
MGATIMTTLLADAGLEKANHTVCLIGQRLTDTQCTVVDLRDRLASLALVATVDPSHEPELVELRQQLAQSEASMRELGAAEQLAKSMAREAREKALQASAQADWDGAVAALDEAAVTAAALEDVARQLGDLYRRLQSELRTAAGLAAPHLKRDEHKMLVQPPDLGDVLKLVVGNSGGPPVDPRSVMHLDAARASIVDTVRAHSQRVKRFRPEDMTEQKDAGHE